MVSWQIQDDFVLLVDERYHADSRLRFQIGAILLKIGTPSFWARRIYIGVDRRHKLTFSQVDIPKLHFKLFRTGCFRPLLDVGRRLKI
jgi:hypothetical protein